MPIRGIDLELIEKRQTASSAELVVPNHVRINGTEVTLPQDASIQIGEIDANSLVTVTMTMTVRSLSIRSEVADA